jgi:hypothetical protein
LNKSDEDYWNKSLPKISVQDGSDKFSISKRSGVDWASFEWECNDIHKVQIDIRSREAAAGIRFMLDQLLRGSE